MSNAIDLAPAGDELAALSTDFREPGALSG
jgi:hypothetical protein